MSQPKDFGFGSDEAALRDQARKFLDEHASVPRLRKLVGADHDAVYVRGELPGFDRSVWQKCVELGFPGLAVPEAQGGIGAKAVTVAALVEEVGRHAFPSPLVATLIASYVLRAAGTVEAERWLEQIASGTTLSLALTNAEGDWSLDRPDVSAMSEGQGLVLSGSAHFVQDAFKVEHFLVAAQSEGGIALVLVPSGAPGLTVVRDHIVDLTRDQAHLTFARVAVPADCVVARAPAGLSALRAAWMVESRK